MDKGSDVIRTAAEAVRNRISGRHPEVGIVLGSGLGGLCDLIEDAVTIPYSSIPGFPVSTAIGHKGNLICGSFGGRTVLAMQGRFHYYEGYSMEQVTLPIRVMALLGIKYLFVSCAVGCVNKDFEIGDLMMIRDHISFLPNPLIGPNKSEFGPRFPDMTCAYDLELQDRAVTLAAEEGITLRRGVLVTCSGPCYETPAEYRFYCTIGGDVVGMSTTPEVIVARHCGLRVLGMSVITDMAHDTGDAYVTDGEEIVRIANAASERMVRLFSRIIASL